MKFGLTIYGPFEGSLSEERWFRGAIASVLESNESQRTAVWEEMKRLSGFDRIEVVDNDPGEVFLAVYHYSAPDLDGLGCVYRAYVRRDGTIASLPLEVK